MTTELDHLVVVCSTLEQGTHWCEQTLGVSPGPGGRHALMGTHNRLLAIASPDFPRAYLELIAIDPAAPPPVRARWFGIDDPALQAAVRESPRLHHLVLATRQLDAQRAALLDLGLDPGAALATARDTPEGRLSWRILVRDDGVIACDAALPTLIEWQGRHPSQALAASPVKLLAVTLAGVPAPVQALLSPCGVCFAAPGAEGAARLQVELATPRGAVMLRGP